MKTTNMTKKEAEQILKKGGKVYLDNKLNYLESSGLLTDNFYDQTGFNFTRWFYLYAPDGGWNLLLD